MASAIWDNMYHIVESWVENTPLQSLDTIHAG